MSADANEEAVESAVEVLQQLGLKEYEARCFVGLTRLPSGTAKEISEVTDVPRTRVYDAVRVLEGQGLVEVRHSSPQQFRAVSLSEAAETLRDRYERRVDRFHDALANVNPAAPDQEEEQEVWAMTGHDAISNRTNRLVREATGELLLVVGHESLITEDLVDAVDGPGSDVDVIVGTLSESLRDTAETAIPRATTFVSGLEWLDPPEGQYDEGVSVGRLLLVDRSTLLVSSIVPDSLDEWAVLGTGFRNGLMVLARRAMARGLVPGSDPAKEV